MTDKQPEALIRAEELEQIGAESSLARAMAAHTIRLLYKENEALRTRLAQPEPEPVAWHEPGAYGNVTVHEKWANENGWLPLYTAPPQREWQGLTDEDRQEIERWIEFKEAGGNEPVPAQKIITYVEAKLKEKNNG